MDKLRTTIERWLEKLDARWKTLPVREQHRFAMYFFAGYLALTAAVIFNLWLGTAKTDAALVIEHIDNAVLKKNESPAKLRDSLAQILKTKIYERK